MKLLCIVGRKRSGKDTIANIISQNTFSEKYALADPIKEALLYAYNEKNLHQSSGVVLQLSHFYGKDHNGNEYDRETPLNISNRDAGILFKCAVNYLRLKYNLKQGVGKDHHPLACQTLLIETMASKFDSFWSIRKMMQMLGTDIVVNIFEEQFWNRIMLEKAIESQHNKYFVVSDIRQKHEIDLMRNFGALVIHVERPSINNDATDDHITEQKLIPEANDIVIKNDGTIENLTETLKSLKVI